ncbi:MAG: hypothetical protein JWQ13_1480 [Ramlibacter sp.]|nr:hypothetical protein [Ramlibacter sp.]
MQLKPLLDRHEGYLRATFTGAATLPGALSMLQTLRYSSFEFSDSLLLLDLRQVEESFSAADEIAMGKEAAKALGHLRRVASLVRENRRTGNSEQVSTASGLLMKVFVSEAEALAWLLEGQQGAAQDAGRSQ